MKRAFVLASMIGLLVLTSGRPTKVVEAVDLSDFEEVAGMLVVSLPDVSLRERPVQWLRLELDVTLSPGVEVQLWRDVDLENPPWRLGLMTGLVDIWVMDERTGSRVSLDVSALAKELGVKTLLLRAEVPGEGVVRLSTEDVRRSDLERLER